MNSTPDRLSEIIEEFQRCDGREKLELLLYYAEKMPTLPEWLQEQHNEMHKVHEWIAEYRAVPPPQRKEAKPGHTP